MDLENFVCRPCRSGADYEFIPKQRLSLDLEELAGILLKKDIDVHTETPYVLLLKIDSKFFSFYKSGKIVVKTIQDPEKAKKIAGKILSSLE